MTGNPKVLVPGNRSEKVSTGSVWYDMEHGTSCTDATRKVNMRRLDFQSLYVTGWPISLTKKCTHFTGKEGVILTLMHIGEFKFPDSNPFYAFVELCSLGLNSEGTGLLNYMRFYTVLCRRASTELWLFITCDIFTVKYENLNIAQQECLSCPDCCSLFTDRKKKKHSIWGCIFIK